MCVRCVQDIEANEDKGDHVPRWKLEGGERRKRDGITDDD